MPTIVVTVMPKAELLDPQGKAVAGALARTGRGEWDVRVGKRFELTTDARGEAALAEARRIADDVLANGVIEDVVDVRIVDDATPATSTPDPVVTPAGGFEQAPPEDAA